MFEIHISDTDVTAGSIQVSWCLDKELIKELTDADCKDPMVVLCVAPEGKKYSLEREVRKIVPLKDLVAYLDFRCSGPHRIYGFVSDQSEPFLKNTYLSRMYGKWATTILAADGSDFNVSYPWHQIETAPPVSVDIPSQAFAEEPAEWEKTWVNHWFRCKPQDQCDFRKRRLLAYTIQPPVMLLIILFRFVIWLIALLFGFRGAKNLKHVFNPITYDIVDFIDGILSSQSIFYRETAKTIFGQCGWFLLSPAVLMCLTFFAYKSMGNPAFLAGILIGIVMVAFTIFVVPPLVKYLSSRFESSGWLSDEKEQNLILCGAGKPKTFAELPSNHKTIKLRFLDLKSKVCKPFGS